MSESGGGGTSDAIRLLELLPGWQEMERQNESPSFGQMVRLGMKYRGTLFFGYRVIPERGTSGSSSKVC